MRWVMWAVAGCAMALGLGAGAVVAGWPGLVLVASAFFVVALLAVRLAVAAPPRPRGGRGAPAGDPDLAFAAYRRIAGNLFWAGQTQRHFDYGVRPMLFRLLAAALAEGHGIDARRDGASARALVGDELWELLDPERPAGGSEPGVDQARLAGIVEALERLSR